MLTAGSLLGERYELLQLRARGGMGAVWRATDTSLQRDVAVKVVDAGVTASAPDLHAVLQDEARHAAGLIGHPNIVSTLDVGTIEDEGISVPFVVMEYVEGPSLAEWAPRLHVSADSSAALAMGAYVSLQICSALEFAHSKGILHRDVKPGNVLLWLGLPKVCDFGLSRVLDKTTREHTVFNFNSPAYCAPEQWNSDRATEATDIYQFGISVFQLLAGELPYKGNVPALFRQHCLDPVPSISETNPAITPAVSDAIARAMAKEPADRGELWQIHDALAPLAYRPWSINVDLEKNSPELAEVAAAILDLDPESVSAKESVGVHFPDPHEALQELAQLVAAGVRGIQLERQDKDL